MNSNAIGEKNPIVKRRPGSIERIALFTPKTMFLLLILWKLASRLCKCLNTVLDSLFIPSQINLVIIIIRYSENTFESTRTPPNNNIPIDAEWKSIDPTVVMASTIYFRIYGEQTARPFEAMRRNIEFQKQDIESLWKKNGFK